DRISEIIPRGGGRGTAVAHRARRACDGDDGDDAPAEIEPPKTKHGHPFPRRRMPATPSATTTLETPPVLPRGAVIRGASVGRLLAPGRGLAFPTSRSVAS